MGKLFGLFDDKLRSPGGLVASVPQTLETIGSTVEDTDSILEKIDQLRITRPKVDYSDFTNFVFFNSALDYFNITGEKILNEYPYDGSSEDISLYVGALDDYQNYALSVWPSRTGHLFFYPSFGFTYVLVDDVGKDGSVSKTSLMSPGTSSFSLEFWAIPPPILTGTNDVMVVFQKSSGSGGFEAFYTGSQLSFRVNSGSFQDSLFVPCVPGSASYFCFSYDRSESTISAFTGSSVEFPVLVGSSQTTIVGSIEAGTNRASMGSGSVSTKVVVPLTGGLDDVRFWRIARELPEISSSFNCKIYAQDGLYGLWRFNESGSNFSPDDRTIVVDHSGRKLNGNVVGYNASNRGSGSIVPFDSPDPMLSLDIPEVAQHVEEQQTSGSLYDRNNDNAIVGMLPEQFFLLEEDSETEVLKNFLFVIARQFDQIKSSIDQFVNVLRTNYGRFDQAPDALLEDVARFFGWEFSGNFLNAEAIQYIVGKQVLPGVQTNKQLDVKLFQIKNEFWKRTLINLIHIYKTKGTRESVETLMRVYGINKGFVRLKEFGSKPNAGIETFRIHSEKSSNALTFGSGSNLPFLTTPTFSAFRGTVEARVRFPTQQSDDGFLSIVDEGNVWTSYSSSFDVNSSVYYSKESPSSNTGSFIYSGTEGVMSVGPHDFFNDKWYNISLIRDTGSDVVTLDVRSLDGDEVGLHMTASIYTIIPPEEDTNSFVLGNTGPLPAQLWMQEFRVWSRPLEEGEIEDHTLNYQSYGTANPRGFEDLDLHLRLNDDTSADLTGQLAVLDYSENDFQVDGFFFVSGENPYKKFLNEYNYIAPPEYGWNEQKIRALDSDHVSPDEAFSDHHSIALEFNLIDALNEDISQIISTMDVFNEYVGAPVNRYRDSYPDLTILRNLYFKKLQGDLNFTRFSDMLEFFDRTFVDMVRRLIPARANFLGDQFVVESHMLERPKLQWNYRRRDQTFQPEGRIKVVIRF